MDTIEMEARMAESKAEAHRQENPLAGIERLDGGE